MKPLLIMIVNIFILIGCNVKETECSFGQNLIGNKKIDSLLSSFVKEDSLPKPVYELYINKVDPHNYHLLIYSGEHSLTQEENNDNNQMSLTNVIVSDKKFAIYSGIEHYFQNPDSSKKNTIVKKTLATSIIESRIWFVIDSFGVFIVSKPKYAYPFMPLPKDNGNIKMVEH